MDLPQIDDYQTLFAGDTPLLDVRAPVEFKQGAFPNTLNVPLMNDEERTQVGIRYKQQGQDQAIELGHRLVSGETKAQRVAAWAEFVRQHPQGRLYCFRGGLRSRITQQWIYEETGIVYPRVKGGYKAMRRFLLNELEQASSIIEPVILSGRTGVGKTLFLSDISQQIDLEGIYEHRGSAFGRHVKDQPGQIDVENRLAIALLKLRLSNKTGFVLEDEGGNIGSRYLPDNIHQLMKQSPVVVLEAPQEERLAIVFHEYVEEALAEHQAAFGENEGFESWANYLTSAMARIQRRLGGLRFKEIDGLLRFALQQHRDNNNTRPHEEWIRALLFEYYDPMYDYQLSGKTERIVFRGNKHAVKDFLATTYQIR